MIEDLLIVAAGYGSRLKAKGNLKPLVEVNDIPLIEHAIHSAYLAGLKRFVVVTGFHAPILELYLKELSARTGWHIETVYNPDYTYPNGLSVLKGQAILKGHFCLTMCDHIVEPKLYGRLLKGMPQQEGVTLAVDTRLHNPFVDTDDVTKVRFKGRRILEIGKEIPVHNAFDTGVFAAGPALFDAISESGATTGDYSISGGMLVLASRQQAFCVDVGDSFWIDVDSPEMHSLAEKWLDTNRIEVSAI